MFTVACHISQSSVKALSELTVCLITVFLLHVCGWTSEIEEKSGQLNNLKNVN